MTEVVAPQDGAPPAPPANALEAQGRLNALVADKDWGAKLLAGDANTNREFRDLNAKLANEDDTTIAAVMKGDIGDLPDSSVKLMAETAGMLREIGINEKVIEQQLRGHEVTPEEYKLAEAYKARAMKDPEFVRSFLSGDAIAREKMTLVDIILAGGIKGEQGSF